MLTFKELKELVPATPKGKMPRADELKKQKIILSKEVAGAKITVFANGYLSYTTIDGFGDPCTTIYSVHRCERIVQVSGASEEEYKEECGSYGPHCRLVYRVINGQLMRFAIISEEAHLDEPWWMPIQIICDERIMKNLDDREARRTEPLNDDDYHFIANSDPEAWLDAVIDCEEELELHNRLKAAMKTLTDIQADTLQVLFCNGHMNERKAASILGITQKNINKSKQAALKKLREKIC